MSSCKDCLNYSVCYNEDKGTIREDFEKRASEYKPRMTAYERTKAAVYATGNKWAIENFHATHY